MDRNATLLLPGVNYFQVVFTIPDRLSRLVLGNRRELYRLLFRAAWRSIKQEIEKQNIEPAALMVLHTWTQKLQHHPHIHAIIPGAGPSLNKDNDRCWVTARDSTRPWRETPSLTNNIVLGKLFRDKFVRGLGWLIRNNKLKLNDEWKMLKEPRKLRRWLKSLKEIDWNVFIQGPPNSSRKRDGKSNNKAQQASENRRDPLPILKYLTRYMTGGPISDRRIESDNDGAVVFQARVNSKTKTGSKMQTQSIKVSGIEFVRRWSLHILPKGFTRSRCYGGYHGSNRKRYIETCRQLLNCAEPTDDPTQPSNPNNEATSKEAVAPICPQCEVAMQLIIQQNRPSWKEIFRAGPNHLSTLRQNNATPEQPNSNSTTSNIELQTLQPSDRYD